MELEHELAFAFGLACSLAKNALQTYLRDICSMWLFNTTEGLVPTRLENTSLG